ncbi:hypothetical protein BN8_02443 [Fibrisoma limi BUZ 3]|uniref:DUF4403 family protein n=1 Tax=Fibrisoma limi BUZ 3 TaxID=1185876 RepID=I2GHH8_9BACT|nr:DUF4403 family protein [Fibrisoma limi]CCH53353.1 hypothetical protein BN8_02443 [Fibrisoma limi BUZ 3]
MGTQRTTGSLFILFFLALSIGCNRVRPKAPELGSFEPPITKTTSYLTGRITFDIADLERKINHCLKPVLLNQDTLDGGRGVRWRLRIERMGPVRIRYARQQVFVSAPLRVWLSNPIGFRKKKAIRRSLCALHVNFASPLAVSSNWRLSTRSKFVNYQWIERPKVRVLGVNIPVTKLADKVLTKRRADIEAALDSAVHEELRLDRFVRRIWLDIQKPLRISRKPEQFWIVPKPISVAVSRIEGNRRSITVPIQIGFEADTRLGEEPVVHRSGRLPRLQRKPYLPAVSSLRVLWFIPYSSLNKVLAQSINDQKFELLRGTLKLRNTTISGGGRALVLRTDVTGAVNGTLYFHGQPGYDTLTNTLRVKDVDYAVDTKESLLSTADWLLHDHLRDTLQNALIIPLKSQIVQFPQKIETAFEHGKAGLKSDLNIDAFRFVPQKIVIRPDGIQLLIKVESAVEVAVKKL